MAKPKIRSVTRQITPLSLYRVQVQNIYDRLRAENEGKQHLSAQLGGLGGQRRLLTEKTILDITEINN